MANKGYVTCIDCGKVRFVSLYDASPRCHPCAVKLRIKPVLPKDYVPSIGEVRIGREIGKGSSGQYFTYLTCPQCRKPRWVSNRYINEGKSLICLECNNRRTASKIGERNHMWKGGRHETGHGYIRITLPPDDFFYPMTISHDHTVPEHRLVMAKHLKRCLQRYEIVHHKNGNKSDNRIENLQLLMNGAHSLNHSKGYRDGYRQGYQDGINGKIQELQNEIRLLRLQLNHGEVPVP